MRTLACGLLALLLCSGASCANKAAAPVAVSPALAPDPDVDADLRASLDALEQGVARTAERLERVLDQLERLERKVDRFDNPPPVPEPKAPARPTSPDPQARYRVEIGDAHARGPSTALVTIVEWTDFQCPFCKKVSPTLEELRRAYGKKLRVVVKHNPLAFHPRALPAAIAAEAAGEQGKFWEMHDLLYENMKDLSDENFRKWARKLRLDLEQFDDDVASAAIAERIADMQAQGTELGVRGTPAFFVNGRFLSGAQPADAFRKLIDEELGKAKALVAAGVPREEVYRVTIEDGRTQP